MNTAVFLQARLSSSRLPNKILLNLDGRTVLEQAMRRLSLIAADYYVVLTDPFSFDIVQKIAFMAGWYCFEGPGNDVLARYVFAARQYAVRTVVRATADNPLVSFELANMLLREQRVKPLDYRAHVGMPYGAGVEIVQADALERACVETDNAFDHEHVTPWIYNNPARFQVEHTQVPEEFSSSELRITLDNEEDYRFLKSLYRSYELGDLTRLSKFLKNMYPIAV